MAQPPPYNEPGYPPAQGNPPTYPGDQKTGYPPQQPGYPAQPGNIQQPGYLQQPGYPQQPGGYPQQQPGGFPQQPGYAPQPGYPPQPAHVGSHTSHTSTTVIAQPAPVIVTGMAFGEIPVSMTCPRCQAQIVTSTIYQDGSFAWLMAGILCLIGCWPCCLLPFCMDGCKDVTHHCPNCRSHLGSYRRM